MTFTPSVVARRRDRWWDVTKRRSLWLDERTIALGLRARLDIRGAGADAAFSQIEEALKDLGVDVETPRDEALGIGQIEGDWVELPVVVSVGILLAPFFHSLASKAGEDAYAALKGLVRRAVTVEEERLRSEVVGVAAEGTGRVTFRDAEAPVEFTLDLRLPDVAFRRLAEIDWGEVVHMKPTWQRSVKLRWDPADEEWWIALFNRRAPLLGAVIELGESNFQSHVIDAETPVLVHFWAPHAAASEALAAVLEELASERADLRIGKLNVDENPAVTGLYSVTAPTLILFKDGHAVHAIIGARPKSELAQEIDWALSGVIVELNESNFQSQVIEADRPILVHFWAPWAAPSLALAHVLAELAGERDDLRIAKLNIDENSDLTARYGIMVVPTLLLFRDASPTYASIGARPKRDLVRELEAALGA
jgi:thioredoxin 1